MHLLKKSISSFRVSTILRSVGLALQSYTTCKACACCTSLRLSFAIIKRVTVSSWSSCLATNDLQHENAAQELSMQAPNRKPTTPQHCQMPQAHSAQPLIGVSTRPKQLRTRLSCSTLQLDALLNSRHLDRQLQFSIFLLRRLPNDSWLCARHLEHHHLTYNCIWRNLDLHSLCTPR